MNDATHASPQLRLTGGPSTRPLLIVGAVAVLMALVFMLPRRAESTAASAALTLTPLEVDEPPAWAVQRGADDEVLRSLDRLDWGGPSSMQASRETLERYAGQLAPLILPRLKGLGPDRAVLAAKLIELLGSEDLDAPEIVAALVNRARSPSGLEAKAALRVLAQVDDPQALDGVLSRLMDGDLSVRSHARAALARIARRGSAPAQAVILTELETETQDPDLAFLAVAADFQDRARVEAVLRTIEASPYEEPALVARTSLLRLGDPVAKAEFERALASNDLLARRNALHALVAAGQVTGWDSFAEIARQGLADDVLPLVDLLEIAVDTGSPEAARAMNMLEALAAEGSSSVSSIVGDRLYARGHPWAIDATRAQVQQFVGGQLSLAVSRVISGPEAPKREMAELALARLQSQTLRDVDRELLLRLLAHVAPELAVELIVVEALDEDSPIAPLMLVLLARLGPIGLQRLERELGTPEADVLFIRVAGEQRSGAALPGLERILLSPGTDPVLRIAALDTLGRLRDGPRGELLRSAVTALNDPDLSARARLVFWNYL